MPETWLVRVYNNRVLETFKECAAALELGRQDNRSREELYQLSSLPDGGLRISIAPSEELSISRRHARVEEITTDRVAVRNVSDSNSIGFDDGYLLRPGQQRQLDLPVVLKFGAKVVRIQRPTSEEAGRVVRSLDEPTATPGQETGTTRSSALSLNVAAPLDARRVFEWLKAMIGVLQSAAGDAEFFQKAARAVVENAGLDVGRVLTRDGNGWTAAALYPSSESDYVGRNPPSRLVLKRVCEQNRASWLDPSELGEDCSSLDGVSSVVAAPVRARSGEVIAVLYGERRLQSVLAGNHPISRLDAMLIDVLAFGVAAGLARTEQERAALRMQTQFEQFFTHELAGQLLAHPELLAGQDREITVIFCDIRGFSRISRKHAAAIILDWTNDVLSTLSDCVQKHQGVLVDYIGDELMAQCGGAPEYWLRTPRPGCPAARGDRIGRRRLNAAQGRLWCEADDA